MKNGNLSIFVPHVGCPHQCAFCNQYRISSTEAPPTANDVKKMCDTFLPSKDGNLEIAFFGGSFTAIDENYMVELLAAAYPFVQAGSAKGIRISTRPDCINKHVLEILQKHGVTAIELGAQSMDNAILKKINRGHTTQDVIRASRLIKEYGFSLGHQMMIGLPFESNAEESAMLTAIKLAELAPDTMRIYPAITIKDTQMEAWYEGGEYKPLSIEQAVSICSRLLQFFQEKEIAIIRVGLHADEGLENGYVAGPYHAAFRQLCESNLYREHFETTLAAKPYGQYTISIAKNELSTAIGHKKSNILYFANKGYQLFFEESTILSKGTYNIN